MFWPVKWPRKARQYRAMPIEAMTIRKIAGILMADKAISRDAVGMGAEGITGAAGAPAAGVGAGATPKRSANSSKAESGCQSVVPSRCARVAAFKRPSVIHWRICAVDTGPYSFWSAPMILNISVVFWGDLVQFMVPTAID